VEERIMTLESYTRKLLKAECNPNIESLYCFAEFDEDLSVVFPYLRKRFVQAEYSEKAPFLLFRVGGKKVSLFSHKIMINPVKDEKEADTILEFVIGAINSAWERKREIKKEESPLTMADSLEIFRMLPQSNCKECGQESCMSFSILAAEGVKGPYDCPRLNDMARTRLSTYLTFVSP
jgi:ArsR family metal-binding transcriptional regulator